MSVMEQQMQQLYDAQDARLRDEADLESRMEREEDDSLTRNLRVSRALACKDRTCGAIDCPTCNPGTWRESAIEEAGGQDDV